MPEGEGRDLSYHHGTYLKKEWDIKKQLISSESKEMTKMQLIIDKLYFYKNLNSVNN